ncbi:type II secretion system protein [Heyndrickxia acidiproducens]|uniref:type II secretion system protein n=1 Tax=Heyndrickxia acidiproducens TaxID=1121084 RepID=UPI00037580F8|nr:type II secretion system protein [Heyndrickxia acidiproducens]
MYRNEKGFTLVEVLAAFTIFCMMATALFPAVMELMESWQESKKEMTAARILYEKTEQWIMTGKAEETEEERGGTRFVFHIEDKEKKACVSYETKEVCVSEE